MYIIGLEMCDFFSFSLTMVQGHNSVILIKTNEKNTLKLVYKYYLKCDDYFFVFVLSN